ncbi:MAG: hypothetical protein C0392_01120 [Syntrophus sp. (in: bacteria)]|nr:hypothetical protein [Syntrophus sp. (in: bacteria)]
MTMSLLNELLSKVTHDKHDKKESGVPPTLVQAVTDSGNKKVARRKFAVIGMIGIVIILAGFGIIYYIEALSGPQLTTKAAQGSVNIQAKAPLRELNPPQPVQPAEVKPIEPIEPIEPKDKGGEEPKKAVSSLPASKTQVHVKNEYVPSRNTAAKNDNTLSVKAPKARTDQSRQERDSFLYTAKSYEALGDNSQALDYYKKALEMDGRNYVIMNNIARIMISAGNFAEAMKYSGEALVIKKDHVPSLVNLGISYLKSGRITEGKNTLLKALTLEPSNNYVLLNLAIFFEKEKDFNEAQKLYGKLKELDNIQGNLGIARLAEKSGKGEEAKRIYRDMLTKGGIDIKTRNLVMDRLAVLENR